MVKTMMLTGLFALLSLSLSHADDRDPYTAKRKTMVDEQILARGISDKAVTEAMFKVERHLFVPEADRAFSYEDYPLSIGYGQTISQPYIVAFMTHAAHLSPGDKVLEIGTGSGYQAAILAEIAKEVYTLEIVRPLAESAEKRLKELGYENIFVKHGDGFKGWPKHAPFDCIILTAAPSEIPAKLFDQLKTGGRMVAPIGSFFQELYLITKTPAGLDKKKLLPVRFVPMVRE